MKIIKKITSIDSKRKHNYEDPITKAVPYFAVLMFVGLVLLVAVDYFLVVR